MEIFPSNLRDINYVIVRITSTEVFFVLPNGWGVGGEEILTIHLVSIHVDKFHVNILKNWLCGKNSPFSPLSNGIFTIKIG